MDALLMADMAELEVVEVVPKFTNRTSVEVTTFVHLRDWTKRQNH